MTVEADIFNTLKPLATTVGPPLVYRVYPDVAPIDAVKPYLVYQQVGGEAPTFLERAVPSKKNGRFQISVWADTRAAAAAIAVQIEAAMVAATAFDAKPLGAPVAVFDEETKLRGSQQDFSVWSDR